MGNISGFGIYKLGGGGGGGATNTIYTANDTIGSGREATLTDTLHFIGTNLTLIKFGQSNYLRTTQAGYGNAALYIQDGNVQIGQNSKFQIASYNTELAKNYLKMYSTSYIQSTVAGLWSISNTTSPSQNIGARFGIETLGSTNATIGFKVQNSSAIDILTLNDASEGKILNNVASPLAALTLENEASGANHTTCGVKLQLTSNADTGFIAQYDSVGGGSTAPTMQISSPTGINYVAGAFYGNGYHYFQNTGVGGSVAFDGDGSSGLVKFIINGGGGTATTFQMAYTGGDYNFIKSHHNTGGKFIFGRENGGSFEYMRIAQDGEVLIGTPTTDASALLNVDSTTKGFLPPRMTTVEMNAIGTPASGLMVFDRTTSQWMGYNGSSWVIIG
tara:strand:+ start:1738 stop:2904 length:1167 start_codon:yes stop_codon:yes gene_type:complete